MPAALNPSPMTNLSASPPAGVLSEAEAQQAAALELQKRRAARRSLMAFTTYRLPGYFVAPHHRTLAAALERVARGECRRLMVFMPPRHGKSELASKSFPAWCIGQRPDMQILAASYNGDIASDFGRAVRNIVSAPEYQCVFPGITVSVDSAAADKWHTNKGGVYFAAGIGTAATGRGADLLIIDDPVKGRQEADSEIERKRTWDWYTSTAYTRLMPNACIALIQTRWHDDDLAGRLLVEADRGGEQWEVLSLPALDDDGRALWPEWYDEAYLANTRQLLGTREFSALYQQKPVPDTGDQFQADWIRLYDDPPATLRVFGASDYAVTESGGDYTVHGVVGVDQHGDLYVLDWWRKQAGPVEWIEAFCALCAKWKPLEWAEEAGQIRGSLDQFIVKRMKELGTTTYRKAYPSVVDKVNRAQSIIGMMSMGRVYFPRRALWTDGLVHELLRFPSGTSDDQVDVLGLFGRMLLRMGAAQKPAPPPEPMKLLQTMTLNELWQAHDQHRGSRTRI